MKPRRFIDANIFVYVLSADPRYSRRALAILEDAEKGLYEAYTSMLVVSQVLAHLGRRRRREAVHKFIEYIESSPILVLDTCLEDFTRAYAIAVEYGLPFHRMWDELVIAAQMERLGITEIYSNDSDFDRIPGVKRLF